MATSGRNAVEDAIRQAGLNLADTDDMERLAQAIRWAVNRQRMQEKYKTLRVAWVGTIALGILSAGGTMFLQWLGKKLGWVS